MSARHVLQLTVAVIQGAVGGAVVIISIACALSWYQGGSADPRCAIGWPGFVTLHHTEERGAPERISCNYEPQVSVP
jgi:hypothetical protein